ncbi:MAG: hypothetical protein J6C39_07220 [Clostridia bacterium]|nr:hypothetical protein [Clostridia bacterium]
MSDRQRLNRKKEEKKLRKMGYNQEELPFEVKLAAKDGQEAVKAPRTKLSPTAWATIITGGIVLIVGIVVLIVVLVNQYKKDPNFDYLSADLSGYIEFSADTYKNYKVEIDIAEPHRKKKGEDGKISGVSDVDVAITNLLCSKSELVDDAAKSKNVPVEIGDTVYYRYQAYLFDKDGEKVYLSGLNDFTNLDPTKMAIGNHTQMMIGLDIGLIGKDQTQYARFDGNTSGAAVTDKHVVYLSYKKSTDGGTAYTYKSERVAMTDGKEKVDGKYGEGFYDFLCTRKSGESGYTFECELEGKKLKYTDLQVQLVTLCESTETNGGTEILTVEAYYPYDYGTTGLASAYLRNETVYFEIYIDGVSEATTPTLSDAFINELLEDEDSDVTAEDLEKYGEYEFRDTNSEYYNAFKDQKQSLVYKYLCYVEDTLWDYYEEARDSMIEDAMWTVFLNSAKVTRYPESKVDEIYEQYVEDLRANYNANKDELDDYGELLYEDIDDYAKSYLSLSDKEKWEDVLYEMSENLVKERLILYYVMKVEGLTPTEEQFAAELAEIKQEYIDEYVRQYIEAQLESDENYDDHLTDYDAFLEARKEELFDFYDEDYFKETTYYEHVLPTLLSYATVSDLNTRRAYPQTK